MATKKTEQTSAEVELEDVRNHRDLLQDRLDDVLRARTNDQEQHLVEVKRLNDIIVVLLEKRRSVPRLTSPEEALEYIISHFETVAVGGSAAEIRLAVHKSAECLNMDQRNVLRDYVMRLRGAAEAAEQEAVTLLL